MTEWVVLVAGLGSLVAFVMLLVWADFRREDKARQAAREADRG